MRILFINTMCAVEGVGSYSDICIICNYTENNLTLAFLKPV